MINHTLSVRYSLFRLRLPISPLGFPVAVNNVISSRSVHTTILKIRLGNRKTKLLANCNFLCAKNENKSCKCVRVNKTARRWWRRMSVMLKFKVAAAAKKRLGTTQNWFCTRFAIKSVDAFGSLGWMQKSVRCYLKMSSYTSPDKHKDWCEKKSLPLLLHCKAEYYIENCQHSSRA